MGRWGPARFDPTGKSAAKSGKVRAGFGAGSNVAPELTYLGFSGGFLTLLIYRIP